MSDPDRVGDYQLGRRLGGGGMGVVYEARHPQLPLRYAVKLIRRELSDPTLAARFQVELEAMAAVAGHPHLVSVRSAGSEHGQLYCVMDLVDGPSLEEVLTRGPLPPRQAAHLALGVARAVTALHRLGIVHRDLKPGNVLVDPEGRARVTDLGLARLLGDTRQRLTRSGELLGTPAYMAPEQARGASDVGPPADVWAFGMLLFALLAGRPAATGSGALQVLERIVNGRLDRLGEVAPGTPRQLIELVERCLQRDPASRPEAAQVEAALGEYLAGQGGGRAWSRRAVGALLLLAIGAAAVVLPRRAAAPAGEGAGREALLARAERALEGEGVAPQLRVELAAAGAEPLLACLAGELALREGDLDAARAALLQAGGETEPALGSALRGHLGALRAGVAVLDSAAPVEGRTLTELSRARERWPERRELRVWQALLLGRAGRTAEALRALADGPPELVDLRAQLALQAGDRAVLEQLLAQGGLEPGLEARSRWVLALQALKGPPEALLDASLAAVATGQPGLPEREAFAAAVEQELASSIREVQRTYSRSSAEARVTLVVRELALHRALQAAHPDYRLDDERGGHFASFLLEQADNLRKRVVGRWSMALAELRPQELSFLYVAIEGDLGEIGVPDLPRTRWLYERAVAQAPPGEARVGSMTRGTFLVMYSEALVRCGDADRLRELAEQVEREGRDPPAHPARLWARLAGLAVRARDWPGARRALARAEGLDPDEYEGLAWRLLVELRGRRADDPADWAVVFPLAERWMTAFLRGVPRFGPSCLAISARFLAWARPGLGEEGRARQVWGWTARGLDPLAKSDCVPLFWAALEARFAEALDPEALLARCRSALGLQRPGPRREAWLGAAEQAGRALTAGDRAAAAALLEGLAAEVVSGD